MHDTREIYPGDEVIRMGPSVPSAGLIQYDRYRVAGFNPRTADGLELEHIAGRWNSANFEVVARPK